VILRRVLIANRGEIAVRIMRTCRRLGIETVLAVSGADADAVPARLADQTIEIGSYLDVDAVVEAAVATTLPVHAALACDDEFAAGGVGTDYLARWQRRETRLVRDHSG